jgi:hypothetical protein
MYSTSHLFTFGDLNFRLSLPTTHPMSGSLGRPQLLESLSAETGREYLKEYDQLHVERKKGTIFLGLREGDFWKFKVKRHVECFLPPSANKYLFLFLR